MRLIRFAIGIALVFFCSGGMATAVSVPGVPRFQQVNENFYRGGQPTIEGFQELKNKGVRTIINLRVDDSERKIVESLGMKYVHIPISMPLVTRPWKQVTESDVSTFFSAIEDLENQPVFVHCHRGADRTGVMVGLYRVAYQKWDGIRAYREARQIGMRWWYRSFKEQLLKYDAVNSASSARKSAGVD